MGPLNSSNPCLPKTHFLKVPIFDPFFKFKPFSFNTHIPPNRAHALSFTIKCKLRSSQDIKNKGKKGVSKKIVLSEVSPPPLTEDDDINGGNGNVPVSSRNKGGGVSGLAKKLSKRVLQILSNLPLAIGEMFTIAALMALGTFIDQDPASQGFKKMVIFALCGCHT